MVALDLPAALAEETRGHLANVVDNLQLIAALGYGDVALVVPDETGAPVVVADCRPSTAATPFAASRVGRALTVSESPEALMAIDRGARVEGEHARRAHDVRYATVAYPIGKPVPFAAVVRSPRPVANPSLPFNRP